MTGRVGIIGGSGFYAMEGMKKVRTVNVATPFGAPSDDFMTGALGEAEVVFLARHGKNHKISPSEINNPANIYGMKKLGVDRIISVSACGSLKEEIKPLDIVIPDQFVDRTNQARRMTFFGGGIAAHVSFSEPVCPGMAKALYDAGCASGASMRPGGTYINMEGPQFSTKAESKLYRLWGMDVIGMTNMAEAKLAREAEICYAVLACVTDYDCWRVDESQETVTVEMIVANLLKNVETSRNIVKAVLPKLGPGRRCACASALKDAIITRPQAITKTVRKRLEPIIGKYVDCSK